MRCQNHTAGRSRLSDLRRKSTTESAARKCMKSLLPFHVISMVALGSVAHADGLLPTPAAKNLAGLPKQIVLGPIYKERHFCSEHTATSWNLGDSLGTDCLVVSDWGHG